jgi:hypothetical protein
MPASLQSQSSHGRTLFPPPRRFNTRMRDRGSSDIRE